MLLYYIYNWEKHFKTSSESFKLDTAKKCLDVFNYNLNILEDCIFEKITRNNMRASCILGYYNSWQLGACTDAIKKDGYARLLNWLSMPNYRCYMDLVSRMMHIYDETVEMEILKLSAYIKICLMPLYKMVFSNIVNKFCAFNEEMSIKIFLQWYIKDEEITVTNDYKKINMFIGDIKNKDIQEDSNLKNLLYNIDKYDKEFDKYDLKIEEILHKMGNINEDLKSIGYEKDIVQEHIKKFILDVLIQG